MKKAAKYLNVDFTYFYVSSPRIKKGDKFNCEALEKIMNEREMSAKQLAKEINVEPSTIKNWLKGKTRPDVLKIMELSEFFGVSEYTFIIKNEKG